MDFKTIEELLNFTNNIKGKTFGEFDKNNLLNNGLRDKGILGKIIETGFYGYSNNNRAEADFNDLGVELKVSGYVKNKNGTISAKERIKLNHINYFDVVKERFDFSKVLFKNKRILIIWYQYDSNKEVKDFIITDYQLYDMSGDMLIIKNDYNIIQEKIIGGLAHELSEGDTSYLGACTSGVNSSKLFNQPYSPKQAKDRSFSLKNSYITGILRSMFMKFEFDVDNVEYKTIEEYVYAQVKKFMGKSQLDIYYKLTGATYKSSIPKNISKMISDKVIGKDRELKSKNDLFLKTNYIIKNLPVNENNYPMERMSFNNLNLSDFNDEWNNSKIKNYFEEVTIIVLCYEGNGHAKNGFRILKDIRKIAFTDNDIELFGRTFSMMKKTIENHDIDLLPYPKSFDGQILEIAPKGIKGDNAYKNLFIKDKTKVCFMLSKDFLFSKISKTE